MNKIISYSLWGNEPFYTVGAIQNAKQNPEIFGNEWTSRFYIHKDVSSDIINQINAYENVEIFIVNENPDWSGMFWRFWCISDPTVDISIFRDTDSRPSQRDYYAVKEWLDSSSKTVNIMRDHPYHTDCIMGGMWGCRNKQLINHLNNQFDLDENLNIKTIIKTWKDNKKEESTKGIDQKFLREMIYPFFTTQNDTYVFDAFPHYNCFSRRFDEQRHDWSKALGYGPCHEFSTGFPTERGEYNDGKVRKINYDCKWNDFIGQVYDENNIPNKEYAELLKQRDDCIYKDWEKE